MHKLKAKPALFSYGSKYRQGELLRASLCFGEAGRQCLQDVENVTFSRTFSLGARPPPCRPWAPWERAGSKPVCCTSPGVELPLHVRSSLPIFRCILEKKCFLVVLECLSVLARLCILMAGLLGAPLCGAGGTAVGEQ